MSWIRAISLRTVAAVTAFAAIGLGGCHPIDSPGEQTSNVRNNFTVPHVLRYATDEDISGLNPWFHQELTLAYMSELTMAWLVRYDKNNRPIPELAETVPSQQNGGVSADGRVITFHVRRGVTWSDGAPFSADDVVFSFQQYLNTKNNVVSRDGWDRITKIDEPDKYTVRLSLRKPYAEFEPTFFSTGGANPCILPKHILGGLAELNDAPYNSLPIGIGPFKYARWDRASEVVLVPNDRYFRGKPRLKQIIFKIIPDANTVLTQLQTGELDLWIPARSYYIDRLRALPGYTVVRQPSYLFGHLDFNLSKPILADRNVRLALRYAIDRPTIKEKISHGFGFVQESYLSPAYPNVPPPIPAVPFDLQKAAQLLEQDGWHMDADGTRSKQGKKLHFVIAMGDQSPDSDATIELLRKWWGSIGVTFDARHFASPVLFAPYQDNGIIARGKFDLTMFSWQVDALDNSLDIFGCNAAPPNGQNDTRYCNRHADELMQEFNSTYNPVEQRRIKAELMKIFVHDSPLIVTRVAENLYVANRDLKNFAPNQVSAFDDMLHADI